MAIGSDILNLEKRLDAAIYAAMETDVAEAVRDEMSRNLESYTYTRSRGPMGMGVRDRRNFDAKVEQTGNTTILTVRDVAKFQGGQRSGKSLAEVVETGDPAYKMPGPRPFFAPTQEKMDAGAAEKALMDGLKRRGFDGVDNYFSFG